MILITGASTGIGLATALHFHKKGEFVVPCVRTESDKNKLLSLVNENKNNWHPVILDVTKSEQIHSAFLEIKNLKKPLKVLINNAGIVVTGPIEFVEINRFRNQFDVNVFGLLEVTQKFMPLLRESEGRIINISSIAGKTVTPLLGPYCASKHVVEVISDALRMELRETNLKVILIEPGSIQTPIWTKSTEGALNDQKSYSTEVHKYYGPLIKNFEKLVAVLARRGGPVESVVEKIDQAVYSQCPKARYLVGRDAKISIIQNLLPDKLRDKIVYNVVRGK